jgi:Helix-turn-helix of DDE superfamily endonuclease
MKWRNIRHLQADAFKRLVGVRRDTFEKMVLEAQGFAKISHHKTVGKKRGPKSTLSIRDEVLMLLMYYREYRTFFHIASSYNISETQCWRIITSLEQSLIKSQLFHLPGKKKLTEDNKLWEVVVVDVSEHSIERPKKSNDSITPVKRRSIL